MSDNPYESPRELPRSVDVEDEPTAQPSHWCAMASLLLAVFGAISLGSAMMLRSSLLGVVAGLLGMFSNLLALFCGEHVFRAHLPGKGRAIAGILLSLVSLFVLCTGCLLPAVQ